MKIPQIPIKIYIKLSLLATKSPKLYTKCNTKGVEMLLCKNKNVQKIVDKIINKIAINLKIFI